jgi:hypothetical protein
MGGGGGGGGNPATGFSPSSGVRASANAADLSNLTQAMKGPLYQEESAFFGLTPQWSPSTGQGGGFGGGFGGQGFKGEGSDIGTTTFGTAPGPTAFGIPTSSIAGQLALNAFDPQNALRAQQEQRLTDQTNSQLAARGLGNTPIGAATTSNALGNFDIGWNAQQLQNEMAGAQGLQNLYQGFAQTGATIAQPEEQGAQINLGLESIASQAQTEQNKLQEQAREANQSSLMSGLSGVGGMLGKKGG